MAKRSECRRQVPDVHPLSAGQGVAAVCEQRDTQRGVERHRAAIIVGAMSATTRSVAAAALPAPLMTVAELDAARAARGFMPDAEGLLLHRAGVHTAARGPLLEVGSYCGKSAIYLGTAARAHDSVLFSVDHHRGSEENQPGEQYCDPAVIDQQTGRIDTLPHFRHTIESADLEPWVIAVVG